MNLSLNVRAEELALDEIDAENALKAKALWYLLLQSQSMRGLAILESTEKYSGFLAWRTLVDDFQPASGGRFTQMLQALLHPKWQEKGNFSLQLRTWEKNVNAYVLQSKESFSDAMKIATITMFAPKSEKENVRLASLTSATDYAKFSEAFKTLRDSGKTSQMRMQWMLEVLKSKAKMEERQAKKVKTRARKLEVRCRPAKLAANLTTRAKNAGGTPGK